MNLHESNFSTQNFRFQCGDHLPELKIHYHTLGTPSYGRDGRARNAVLILHGTTGSGEGFLRDQFAGELFGPGQLLDVEDYYIILPDGIGHGQSSKPSDGLRANFPAYTYDDMVRAQYRLVTEGLGINRLRVVMGTSMGGMHTWVWGYQYPDFMDALLPLASAPVEIAGRNRMVRKMILDAIRHDPAWQQGDYSEQPPSLVNAIHLLIMMTSCPLHWHELAPTAATADDLLAELITNYCAKLDANDMLYAFNASRDYNPAPHLEKITAPLIAINSADDLVNPPELGILAREILRMQRGKYVLLPTSAETRGHGTHSWPALWQEHLAALLAQDKIR